MKRLTFVLSLILVSFGWSQDLKPYVLGAESSLTMSELKDSTRIVLQDAGFSILGEYQPAGDASRWVVVINSKEMLSAVKQVGGLTGFAAAMRVALTEEGGKINISYTNPIYLGNAYFQQQFNLVSQHFEAIDARLLAAMPLLGSPVDKSFGVEDGMSARDVAKYHYMFGMEYFEDVVELAEFASYDAGKNRIETNLARNGDTQLVYRVEIPGMQAVLYGIALGGETGEAHFLPIIDISSPKHTAFLPYEFLLLENEAVMMHGRYRIALAFPDLTMTTFGKIMSTPGDIEDLMRSVTE